MPLVGEIVSLVKSSVVACQLEAAIVTLLIWIRTISRGGRDVEALEDLGARPDDTEESTMDSDLSHDQENASPQLRAESKTTDGGQTNAAGEKFSMQADGGGQAFKGKPDGVSASPERGDVQQHGRSVGGESQGGPYPNPHIGQKPTWGGLLGHGGQTDIGYHGGDQAGQDGAQSPNSATRGDADYSDQEETDSARDAQKRGWIRRIFFG